MCHKTNGGVDAVSHVFMLVHLESHHLSLDAHAHAVIAR
jgi:hypothetical protein